MCLHACCCSETDPACLQNGKFCQMRHYAVERPSRSLQAVSVDLEIQHNRSGHRKCWHCRLGPCLPELRCGPRPIVCLLCQRSYPIDLNNRSCQAGGAGGTEPQTPHCEPVRHYVYNQACPPLLHSPIQLRGRPLRRQMSHPGGQYSWLPRPARFSSVQCCEVRPPRRDGKPASDDLEARYPRQPHRTMVSMTKLLFCVHALIADTFVKTNMQSEELVQQAVARGVEYATVSDAAAAALKFASDVSISGKPKIPKRPSFRSVS